MWSRTVIFATPTVVVDIYLLFHSHSVSVADPGLEVWPCGSGTSLNSPDDRTTGAGCVVVHNNDIAANLEGCMGRNFRILPGRTRGSFGRSPKFAFRYVTRTPPKPVFLVFHVH